MQLSIANTPIPADVIGSKRFFRHVADVDDGLVDEYNRILNDKLREGVSNLERHRYLTYMVGADDVDAATPKLARIRADVCQTLARIRCDARPIDGEERLGRRKMRDGAAGDGAIPVRGTPPRRRRLSGRFRSDEAPGHVS